jgi:hypothetical protein
LVATRTGYAFISTVSASGFAEADRRFQKERGAVPANATIKLTMYCR